MGGKRLIILSDRNTKRCTILQNKKYFYKNIDLFTIIFHMQGNIIYAWYVAFLGAGVLVLSVEWKKYLLKILCLMKHYNELSFILFNWELRIIIRSLQWYIQIFFHNIKFYWTVIQIIFYDSKGCKRIEQEADSPCIKFIYTLNKFTEDV